jgi:maltose O-acetyltransferase
MLAGELYIAADPELVADREACERALRAYNAEGDEDERARMMRELLGAFGDESSIRPPFFCDYGSNIRIGANAFLNFNCVILDVVPITIGDRVQIASAVQLLAADHPLDAVERASGREFGAPITVEDDVWLGGGVVICPGVTVGSRSVIGAGSVVTRDVPDDVLAAGNPCRVIRPVE